MRSTLLAVPNISEGARRETIDALVRAIEGGGDIRLLDVHSDADHDRSVFTFAGAPGEVAAATACGSRARPSRGSISRGPAAPVSIRTSA